MKKSIVLIFCLISYILTTSHAKAQSAEVQQLLLNVEKLAQFKQILSDMKKGYQILSGGYNTIKDISEGNFSLHKTFLDGLMQVSPAVRNYRKVGLIIDYQIRLVNEYHTPFNRFTSDDAFTPGELTYLSTVYDRLQKESIRNLDELLMVVAAGQTRMSDDERLEAIDRIHADMQDKLLFLKSFNKNTSVLALQRAKERNDAKAIKKTHGLND